jgi:hypothetical protein
MIQKPINPFTPAMTRRITRRRWMVRAVAGLVVVASLGYAMLPLWLPVERIRRQLETDLTEQVGWPVRIESIRVGWLAGVTVNNLTIAPPQSNGDHPLLRVGTIRCDLAPLGLATGRKIRELEFVAPEIWLDIDKGGNLNLPTPTNKGQGRLPSWNYCVRGLLCHIRTGAVAQTFRIDDLDLQLDPPSGLLHLASATRVTRPSAHGDEPKEGRLEFEANVRIPRLKKSEQLNGQIQIEWSNLALNDLPVPLISRVPVEQVDGNSDGRLTLKARPDLGVDYSLTIALDGVWIMRPELAVPAQVPDAELRMQGHWDPTESSLDVRDFLCETPSVTIRGAPGVSAMRFDPDGEQPLDVHLKGQVKNWAALRREIPDVDHLAKRFETELSGTATFTADMTRRHHEDQVALSLNADSSRLVGGLRGTPWLSAQAGLVKQLEFKGSRHLLTGRSQLSNLSVRLGDVAVQAKGEVQLPTMSPTSRPDASLVMTALPTLLADTKVTCRDADQLRTLFPRAAESGELPAVAGPLEATVRIDPEGSCSRFQLATRFDQDARITVDRVIRKIPGKPLAIRAELRLPYAAQGEIEPASASLEYGNGRLELTSKQGGMKYRVAWSPADTEPRRQIVSADAQWSFGIQLRQCEELASLSPVLSESLAGGGLLALGGDLHVDGRTSLSYRAGDALLRTDLYVLAHDLGLQVGDWLEKRRGQELALELSQSTRLLASEREQNIELTIVKPSGRIRVSGQMAEHPEGPPSDRAEQLFVAVEMDEVADWIDMVPRAKRGLDQTTATGPVRLEFQGSRIGDRQSGHISADAGRAAITTPQNVGFTKQRSIPADVELGWEAQPSPDHPGTQVFRLTNGRGRLGGASIEKVEGELVIGPDAIQGLRMPNPRDLERMTFSVAGALDVGEESRSLHPAIARAIDEARLTGRGTWRVGLGVDGDRFNVNGQIDGGNLACVVDLHNPLLGRLQKTTQLPASLAFSATVSDWQRDGPHEVSHHGALTVGDNSVSGAGSLVLLPSDAAHGWVVGPLSFTGTLQSPQSAQWLALLPEASIDRLAGAITAEATVRSDRGPLVISAGHVTLDNLEVGEAAHPLRVSGSVSLDEERVNIEQLDWNWGQSSGTVTGTVCPDEAQSEVLVGIGGRQILVAELSDYANRLAAKITRGEKAPTPRAGTSTGMGERVVAAILPLLVRVDVNIDTLTTPLPLGITAVADGVWKRLDIQNGVAGFEFGCAIDGGLVHGKIKSDLNSPKPEYRLEYVADRIQPGPVVNAYLRRTFPGMEATGPLTLIDESLADLLPPPGSNKWETGKGQLIIDGGTVSGRAAPLWMTRFFPGLNLSSFTFSRMHSWFDKTDDGRVHHQMIYKGAYYDVYMIGWGDKTGYFDYEVGLDFLAGLESEYWANSGQGRIPLFTKTGKVRSDGSLEDEVVTFVSLKRVAETLVLRNNPLVTAYHAVRKRVLGQQ